MATSLALIRRRRDFRWATTKSMHNSETVMPILQAKTLDDTRSFDRMRDKRLEEHCHTHCICRPSLGLDGQVESKAGRHARSGLKNSVNECEKRRKGLATVMLLELVIAVN